MGIRASDAACRLAAHKGSHLQPHVPLASPPRGSCPEGIGLTLRRRALAATSATPAEMKFPPSLSGSSLRKPSAAEAAEEGGATSLPERLGRIRNHIGAGGGSLFPTVMGSWGTEEPDPTSRSVGVIRAQGLRGGANGCPECRRTT